MTQPVSISLCMIVKNEEAFIKKCLESVQSLVDEMIIVDTGSTDQTLSICDTFEAKVFPYTWDDHFANARNYGLQQATGDWILWLDADEQLDHSKTTNLTETLQTTKALALSLPVINYIGDQLEDMNQQAYLYYQPRLFRNHQAIRFVDRIHETLQIPSETIITYPDLSIHHFGYIQEIQQRKNKAKRNKQLLKKEYVNDQHNPWTEYHLASEYYREQDYQEAFDYINQSLLQFLLSGKKPPALLYKMKYDILLRTNSLDQALTGIEKALQLYPDYVDLHYYKGCILFEQEAYASALTSFDQCLTLGEDHPDYLVLKGVGSDMAQQWKDACLAKLKEKDQ
ncbi:MULTISPECIES: glycosyltransferase family 2 protein [Gracilibacillus]|uniref:glycosyltransferase family 2 protein n=1 Tax=Gracilibacillus TaxID=74385 RepID=UPI0008248EF0|nr:MULTISPECIES: glycosyltransferase family 2 protein [Gracilibacillus]